jgi:hypothetical protein
LWREGLERPVEEEHPPWVVEARCEEGLIERQEMHFEMSATLLGEQWVRELERAGSRDWRVELVSPDGIEVTVLGAHRGPEEDRPTTSARGWASWMGVAPPAVA